MATNARVWKEHTHSLGDMASQHLDLPKRKDRWEMQGTAKCNRWLLKQTRMCKIITKNLV